MLDTRALELINAEIDGELAADEHAELRALLASSAEARAMQADLQRLSNLIDSVPEQVPQRRARKVRSRGARGGGAEY